MIYGANVASQQILTPRQRRARHREAVIEDILAIAREMMQADGVAALSFNAIARRLGMQPPSLYTYFESKDAIYDELFRRGFEEFGRRMRDRPDAAAPIAENLRSVFTAYMRFGLENRDLFELMFQRPVPGFVPSAQSMEISLTHLAASHAELGAALEQAGIDLQMPVDEAGDLLIAMMYGITALHLANNPELPIGEGRFGRLIDQAVALFLNGWNLDEGQTD